MKYALALCAVSVFAVGCDSDSEQPGKPLVLGAIVDQTGNNSELSWLTAVEFATNQWNEALALEGVTDFHFRNSVQNSENDVAGGSDSRAIARIREAVLDGAKAATIDTTQIAEEVNKPRNMNQFLIPMQCSSCTGGSFLSPTSAAVAGDDELTASRRNTSYWMSRTIMSTGLQAQVVSQLIRASVPGCSTCLPGDINGDGILKVANFGSNEPFGSATTLAVGTELLKLYTAEQRNRIHFERLLHVNENNPRDIDFVGAVTRLTNTVNEDLPPADATTASVNAHLFGQTVDPNDGAPDFITVATFGRNDVAYITEIRGRNIPGYGSGPEATMRSLHFQTFRFSSNLLSLGELAEGEVGVSHVVLDGPAGDQFAADFQAKYGIVPVYRDSIYYDNAMTMLTALYTAMQRPDVNNNPDVLTGEMVRAVMPCSSVSSARTYSPGCTPVAPATTCERPVPVTCPAGPAVDYGPGVEGIRTAIRAINLGQALEYTGASGPVNYDVTGNVKNKVANYTVQNGRYVDLAQFDCVTSNACQCTEGSCPVPQ